MPPLPADSIHARACKLKCEKILTRPSRPFTTAFVSGNHENYDALAAYPQAEWHGGRVRTIRPSVLMLERG